MIWTAGVKPADLATDVPGPHTRANRIEVDDHLRVLGVDGRVRDRRRGGRPRQHGKSSR